MISKPIPKDVIKVASKVNSFQEVQKSLQDIEKQLNALSKSVNQPAESQSKETEGKSGDTRMTANADSTYNFEICTKDGWKIPVIGNSVVKFSNKPADVTKPAFKSIDDIEKDDVTTGDSKAKKTIFDEKVGKFVLARPDYVSGWFVWDHSEVRLSDDNPHVLTHNLGAIPIVAKVWFAGGEPHGGGTMSSGANPTISTSHGSAVDTSIINWASPIPVTYAGDDHDEGIMTKVTSTTISLIGAYDVTIKSSDFNSPATWANYDDGYMRVLLWK